MQIVPKNLPSIERLAKEGIMLTDNIPHGIKPLQIIILNLMPEKQETEEEYYRAFDPLGDKACIQYTLAKMSGLTYKHTPQEYMDTFYTDIADIMLSGKYYDGMIITGAPFERFEYEEITYWEQIKDVFKWSDIYVHSVLHICWGAFARIYYNWGIHFKRHNIQWSGVYPHKILYRGTSLVDNSLNEIPVPVSRPWYLDHDEVHNQEGLEIISESPITGPGMFISHKNKHIYTISHPEYRVGRLDFEYKRDKEKGKNPMKPCNYYQDDDETKPIIYSWKEVRDRFFGNWILDYVIKKV